MAKKPARQHKKPAKRGRKPAAARTPRTRRPKGAAPKVSALDAAATLLAEAGEPMRPRDLIARMAERGLWTSPKGKTPDATLNAAIIREIAAKGRAARFRRTDRGLYAATAAARTELTQQPA